MVHDKWGDVPILDYKTEINFLEVAKLKKGVLYQLKIGQASEFKIPTKRLSLGYFYVQKNRIMRIWENNDYEAQGNVWTLSKKTLNRIIKTSKIPKYSATIWQKKTYKDTLKRDKIDWHQYLKKIQDSPKKETALWWLLSISTAFRILGDFYLGRRNWVDLLSEWI